jgi:REP element-mobilizing transposase RayT
MPFWKCYYHVIWTTKYRQPSITPVMEPIIYAAVERKCQQIHCELLALNGTSDHVHAALIIPPAHNAAYVIGQIKGAASRDVNHALTLDERFAWQEGYGVLSYGEKAIASVLDYIARQKEHHANGSSLPYLEQTDD